MARIYWLTCPRCAGRFYAEYADFRHKGHQLWCPYCACRFAEDESPAIDDRWPGGGE
jgi:hypothetical protein